MKHFCTTTLKALLLCLAAHALVLPVPISHAEEGVSVPLESMSVKNGFDYDFERTHDRGVYARLGFGAGLSSMSRITGATLEEGEDAFRLASALHLGGFVAEGVALHASHMGLLGARQGHLGLGIGVTLFPNPQEGLFVSGSLGGFTPYDTVRSVVPGEQFGMTGEVELGTGWWLTPNSSLNLSLYAGGSHLDLEADSVLYVDWRFGLRVGLSLN